MSANHNVCLLYREKAKSTDENRTVLVFEHDNMSDFSKTLYPTYYTDDVNDVTLCAHTYVRIECMIQYFDTRFEHCEVTITDRFTMESTRFTLEHDDSKEHGSGTNPKYYNVQIPDESGYSIAQFAYDQVARVDNDERINGKKFSSVTLLLSMADFPHFGDIDFQFYGVHDYEKDKYSDPVIVQFTNAPTVIAGNLYKWHPHNSVDTPDYDNVFNDRFGAFWDSSKRGKEDLGRTDVLLDDASDGYIDVYSAHRLMTNGIRDSAYTPMSVYGHPVYIAHYDTFIPKKFATAYGVHNNASSVRFVTAPLHEEELGTNCCSYLTTSGNLSTSADADDAFKIRIVEVDGGSPDDTILAVSGSDTTVSITGRHQRFNSYIGCITGDLPLSDGNGTYFDDRKSDEWFRSHTMLHADFALTGFDPYWMDESEEMPVNIQLEYQQRAYYSTQSEYTPPVFELSWYAAGTGTVYSLLRKNGNRNNSGDWITVFDYHDYPLRNGGHAVYVYRVGDVIPDSSRVTSSNSVALTEENYHIKDCLPELELDANNRPIIKMQCGGYVYVSDDADAADHFRVLEEKTNNGLKATVIRTSDWAGVDFTLNGADAEFIIIYRV